MNGQITSGPSRQWNIIKHKKRHEPSRYEKTWKKLERKLPSQRSLSEKVAYSACSVHRVTPAPRRSGKGGAAAPVKGQGLLEAGAGEQEARGASGQQHRSA